MQVKLKLLVGSSAGREVAVSTPEFIIGRGEGTHLRPQSDMISRNHCAIITKDGNVWVKDLKSRNGTYINDMRLEGPRKIKTGDRLKVGKLEFEIVVDHALGGQKRPQVSSVKEAASRVAGQRPGDSKIEDSSVTDWLEEADEVERTKRLTDPDTRQFKLDETERIALEAVAAKPAAGEESEEGSGVMKKKEPGKLPKMAGADTKDSCEAASNMLKKFFNRR
jgi:pSer/pThr/pTyr-binding forkhead associated (FHA) protein